MNFKKYFHVAVNNPFTCLYAGFHLFRKLVPFEYKLLNGYSISPEIVTILVTKRCNFKCSFCVSNSPQVSTLSCNELSTQKKMITALTTNGSMLTAKNIGERGSK